MEVWKEINKSEHKKYMVSSIGRIKSMDSFDSWGRRRSGMLLKDPVDKFGYPRISLTMDGVKGSFRTHRLVAIAFIPNPKNYPQVNHINGIKTDNRVENLEWCNNSHNQIHAIKNGLKKVKFGSESTGFKRKVLVYNSSGELLDTLVGNTDMKNKGYDYRNVSAVLLGKRKTYLGLYFKKHK